MGNCASTMRIIDSIELGLDDGGLIKIEGKKKVDKSLTRDDCGSGVFNRIFLSRYGVGNQANSASLQDTTLDEIFTLRSKLDEGQTRTSTANLLNSQASVADPSIIHHPSPSPALRSRRRFADDDVNSSSFEALILDLDDSLPYTHQFIGRGPIPQDINDFGFSVLPCGETDYTQIPHKSLRRNRSQPSSHNSPRLLTRQSSREPEECGGGCAPVATPKPRSSHLAIHKNDPINTSTGSSTSGVEISSISSRSELPNGASLPRLGSSSKLLLYQPSYDPDDFLTPEDFENPLFIYRSLSFRRAIEEGGSPSSHQQQPPCCGRGPHHQLLSFIGGAPSNAKQKALRDYQQDSAYFHASQDSGHAQSLSLGSNLSIDGRPQGLQPPPSLPLADESTRGPAKGFSTTSSSSTAVCHRPSLHDPASSSSFFFGSQDESIDRFVWRSFTSDDSGFDPVQNNQGGATTTTTTTDLNADSSSEDPFCRNHLSVELRVSPGRRRCLSTLTEEELTEAMSSGPYQPTHPFPFPAPSSTRGLNAHQPLTGDALKRPANEARHMPAPLAVTISTGRRTVEATPPADHNVDVPDRLTKRPEECRHQPSTVSTAATDVTRPTSAATDVATRVIGSDTSRAKPGATEASSSGAEAEGAAAEPVERTSILIKAKRKSLHEMRHLQNIAATEEPSTECEEGQNTTKTTKQQRGATSNDNNNGCPVPSSDKLRQVAEEPSAPDDPSDDDPSPSPFPSLTDELLQQLEKRDVDDDKTLNPEELSLQESEEKFTSLALAFKTDRETLSKRIELHLRARDVAEQNIHKELESLKDGIKVLNQSCTSCPSSSSQVFTKIQTHFDVLEKSITRMSSRAEVHGAVQQELRVSQVIETMLEHVENLKRTYQTEHRELQEARQSLNDGSQDGTETPGSSKVVDRANFGAIGAGKGSLRRISLALMAKSPKLLRNTSLPVSDSLYSSSPAAAATPPLPPTSMLFSNDIQENSCPDDDDDVDAIASRGSNKPPQPNRRYTTNQAASSGDRRLSADDVRKRRFAISHRGSVSNRGGGVISKDEGRVEPASDPGLDQKKQTLHRELLMRVVALLRLLLQRSSIASIRDGLSVLLGAISKFHPLRVVPPALIVIVMFLMSAATLLVVICTRWRVPSQAMPSR